jgi:Xaa-Pro aminopeptidase
MEPLYMIPGRMGFHVEDMYLITPSGFEALTGTITPNDELIRVG